ncbi:MAG: sulfotransferase [Actinomycetota bacterium]|nr:sulfotransferase [Actinomycetota bacterium]
MSRRLPNMLYIGPDKAGSTWLHEVLIRHPQIYLTPAKDLYFFDRYYDRGVDWYAQQFCGATDQHAIVGEICQDYLFHDRAAGRIAETLGPVKLMVTLRDPADRAFSSYLYMRKQGQSPGTFRQALSDRPELVEHGRYATGLRRFLDHVDRSRIHVAVFDDLVEDPQGFIDATVQWLGVAPFELDQTLLAARLPASRARSALLARSARRAADWAREHDGAAAVGTVKRSALAQRLLYRPLAQRPVMCAEDRAYVWEALGPEIDEVDATFGVRLRSRWGGASPP